VTEYCLKMFLLFLSATVCLSLYAWERPAPRPQSLHLNSDPARSTNTKGSIADLLVAKEKTLPEAQKRKDIAYLKSITTDDFLDVGPDGKIYTKDDVLEGMNQISLEDFSLYNVKVLSLTENAAVVTYDAVVHMTIGSEEAPRYQRLSSVWVNHQGSWLLKFQQATVTQ